MSRLQKAVQAMNSTGSITGGRTSIKCSEIAEKYPNGIHITGLAENEYNGRKYYVFTFVEEPNKYFSAGKVLTEKTNQLLEAYDGNIAELNKDLSQEHLEVFLSVRRGGKYTYIDAGFGGTIPAENKKSADGDAGDDEILDFIEEMPF